MPPDAPLEAWREHLRRPQARLGRSVRPGAPQVDDGHQEGPRTRQLAALYAKIADNGGAEWIGDWTPNVGRYIGKRADMILKSGVLPYFVVYNIPKRDCGQYSAGGAAEGAQVQGLDHQFATSLGNRARGGHPRAGLAGSAQEVLSPKPTRKSGSSCCASRSTLSWRWATPRSTSTPGTRAGSSRPRTPSASRRPASTRPTGSRSTSRTTRRPSTEIAYGKEISKLLGGKHFVIDTSRNGNGPPKCTRRRRREVLVQPAGTRPRLAADGQHGRPAHRRLSLAQEAGRVGR